MDSVFYALVLTENLHTVYTSIYNYFLSVDMQARLTTFSKITAKFSSKS